MFRCHVCGKTEGREEFVHEVSERYIELFERITGDTFVKADTDSIDQRILKNINDFISK